VGHAGLRDVVTTGGWLSSGTRRTWPQRTRGTTMSRSERDWTPLINKRAAVKEQFPTLARVLTERPGCREDRARREFYAADNRMSVVRARDRERAQEADADRFIAEMRERKRAKFLAAVREKRKVA
jgi:hypothetical protein